MSSTSFSSHAPPDDGFATSPDGTRIHYEVWTPGAAASNNPTLLLSDGIGCDGYVWKYLVRRFAPEYRIIHWQYRGHGKSGVPHDRSHTSFDWVCADLEAVLRETNTPRALFIGHSMGVQVCLDYYRRHPEAVEALVLICGSHGLPLDTFHDSRILHTLVPLLLRTAEKYPSATEVLWRKLAGSEVAYQIATHAEVNGRLVSRADFHPYFEHLAGLDPQLFLSMLQKAGEHSAYEHLPEIDIPTLIVAGTDDGFTPYWLSEEMHDRIPGSELLTIPGGTHTAPIEQPELLELRLEKFFAELPQERGQQERAATGTGAK